MLLLLLLLLFREWGGGGGYERGMQTLFPKPFNKFTTVFYGLYSYKPQNDI